MKSEFNYIKYYIKYWHYCQYKTSRNYKK